MTEKKPIETPEDLVQAIEELILYSLVEDTEEAENFLRDSGYDLDDVEKRGAGVVQQASANSPLDWRNKTKELETEKERLADIDKDVIKGKSRAQILLDIKRIALQLHHSGVPMTAYRNLDKQTDDDVVSVYIRLRYLLRKQGLDETNEE